MSTGVATPPSPAAPAPRGRPKRGHAALYGAAAIGVVMVLFAAVLATRKSAIDQQATSPLLGRPAPALTGAAIAGGASFDLTSLRGKYVLVNFFASWCVPCQHEQPQLVRFASEATGDRMVVGVLFQDTAGAARDYLQQNGGSWPAIADDGGQHALDWGVRGPPESYLVAPDGTVLAKFVGEITAANLDRLIARYQAAAA